MTQVSVEPQSFVVSALLRNRTAVVVGHEHVQLHPKREERNFGVVAGRPGRDGVDGLAIFSGTAATALLSGEIVRIGNGHAYATDYTDPLAASWKLGIASHHADVGQQIRVQLEGDFSDVAYSLTPGRVWLGGPGQRYGVQTPPPHSPGVVHAVLGQSTGGSTFFFEPDVASIFLN